MMVQVEEFYMESLQIQLQGKQINGSHTSISQV